MSNRVYLYCTDFSTPPAADDWPAFGEQSGTEYEAAYCIPLFWLCLFSPQDIRLAHVHSDDEEEERDYAYLACTREAGLARLTARSSALRGALGAGRHAVYEEWVTRIEREMFSHILVRTGELDMMDEEGQFQQDLHVALHDLDAACKVAGETEVLAISPALANMAGLPNPPELQHYGAFALVGVANNSERWPQAHNAALETQAPPAQEIAQPPARPWWKFW